MARILHILNGDSLKPSFEQLTLEGDVLIWREMLCEGPINGPIGETPFIETRSSFLSSFYEIPPNEYKEKFVDCINNFGDLKSYKEVNLWFEYD